MGLSDAKTTPSVIIVGAGPAGIAAATRLLENKYNKIVVLEAENRIGGRINSVYFGEAFIDLGAEWCHGQKGNIVYELAKDFHILQHTDRFVSVYDSSQKHIDNEFGTELINLMLSIYYADDGQRNEKENKSLGAYCLDK